MFARHFSCFVYLVRMGRYMPTRRGRPDTRRQPPTCDSDHRTTRNRLTKPHIGYGTTSRLAHSATPGGYQALEEHGDEACHGQGHRRSSPKRSTGAVHEV